MNIETIFNVYNEAKTKPSKLATASELMTRIGEFSNRFGSKTPTTLLKTTDDDNSDTENESLSSISSQIDTSSEAEEPKIGRRRKLNQSKLTNPRKKLKR